jgi:hypothetical protein
MKALFRSKASYKNRILLTDPQVYFPLDETSGTTIVNYGSLGTPANGSYSGVSLRGWPGPFGSSAPYFDGANDYANIASAAFAAAFNADRGTYFAWARAYDAGVWTDGLDRYILMLLADNDNKFVLNKSATNNTICLGRKYDTHWSLVTTNLSLTTWFSVALTWSVDDNQVKAYINGSQVGGTLATGAFAGSLVLDIVGAANTTPNNVWNGYIAHLAVWNRVFAAGELLALSQ